MLRRRGTVKRFSNPYSMLSVQISHAIPSLAPNRQQAMFLMSGLITKISRKGDHFALFHQTLN